MFDVCLYYPDEYYLMFALCSFQACGSFPLQFAYAFLTNNGYEYMNCGSTIKGWWNLQRMTLIQRTTSHLFGFIDTITKQLGLPKTNFAIIDKMVTGDIQKIYEKEIFDFGGLRGF